VQRPRGALQQPDAQPRLEARDELADGRRGEAERWGSGGEAVGIDDTHEGGHFTGMIYHCAINENHSLVIVKQAVLILYGRSIR
jgi:hypothetical protein